MVVAKDVAPVRSTRGSWKVGRGKLHNIELDEKSSIGSRSTVDKVGLVEVDVHGDR